MNNIEKYILENPKYLTGHYQELANHFGVSYEQIRNKARRLRKKNDVSHKSSKKISSAKQSWDEKKEQAVWSYDGYDKIECLDDALKYSKVDLSIWEVERHVFNKWPTTANINGKLVSKNNVQVKVWFKKKIESDLIDFSKLRNDLQQSIINIKVPVIKGTGTGVVVVSDFHFGAYIDKLAKTPTFNFNTIVRYLSELAYQINEHKYEKVHLSMLGDFIESFTGLNHNNSWKGLSKGAYGMSSIILCFEILRDSFINKINNLVSIDAVSGNHDRVTSDKAQDDKGEVAQMLAYMLKMQYPNLEITYDPMIISKVYDDISYVFTHGHLTFSKKEITRTLFEYGKQGLYNVVIQGHLHSRMVKKTYKRKQIDFEDYSVVELDEQDYRTIIAPPIFTGNFFSESIGFTSSAGGVIMENNGKGKINYFDYCL